MESFLSNYDYDYNEIVNILIDMKDNRSNEYLIQLENVLKKIENLPTLNTNPTETFLKICNTYCKNNGKIKDIIENETIKNLLMPNGYFNYLNDSKIKLYSTDLVDFDTDLIDIEELRMMYCHDTDLKDKQDNILRNISECNYIIYLLKYESSTISDLVISTIIVFFIKHKNYQIFKLLYNNSLQKNSNIKIGTNKLYNNIIKTTNIDDWYTDNGNTFDILNNKNNTFSLYSDKGVDEILDTDNQCKDSNAIVDIYEQYVVACVDQINYDNVLIFTKSIKTITIFKQYKLNNALGLFQNKIFEKDICIQLIENIKVLFEFMQNVYIDKFYISVLFEMLNFIPKKAVVDCINDVLYIWLYEGKNLDYTTDNFIYTYNFYHLLSGDQITVLEQKSINLISNYKNRLTVFRKKKQMELKILNFKDCNINEQNNII